MKTADFDFELPEDLIAQTPAPERDASRLLVLRRETGAIEHHVFRDIVDLLAPGDLLVTNVSRVIPARLHGSRSTGGALEMLLLQPQPEEAGRAMWTALLKPGRRLKDGELLRFPEGIEVTFSGWDNGVARVAFPFGTAALEDYLERAGETPFPPYITPDVSLKERYQTVYARTAGSVAAPTAGLHFTPAVLDRLEAKGVGRAEVTLHVGLGTFRPVESENVEDHVMHSERYEVSTNAALAINAALFEGRRVIAVGTTSVRVLESAAKPLPLERKPGEGIGCGVRVVAGPGETSIFLTPGSRFSVVRGLVTNFHLPKSTLLMLVSAFAGREHVLRAYEEAVRERYRFYSFGDAMLVL